MRRTNLCAKPAETLDAKSGDPNNWKDFKNGTGMSLQPGRYVASCNITKRGSKNAVIQFWDETHHVQLGVVWNGVIGVNVMQFDVQTASDKCNFSACGCKATDFIVERADTHALASGGGSGLLHRRHRAVLSLRVEADINSGYLYLGGFLGRLGAGRGTFQTVYFRNKEHERAED